MKPILQRIKIPIIADSVLSPQVHYGHPHYNGSYTGIYFNTEDEQYGRITFEDLDSLKVSRGEMLPYYYDWGTHETGVWVFKVENSPWLLERYAYEKEHYGDCYGFGGDVEEMKTDFNHYIFCFHDEFVEVTTKGFWFEKSNESLFGKPLQTGHPFLSLTDTPYATFEAHTLSMRYWTNNTPIEDLIANAKYCTQILMQFALYLEGKARVDHTLILRLDEEGNPITHLTGYFRNKEVSFNKIADLDDVKPYLEDYMKEIYETRQKKKK